VIRGALAWKRFEALSIASTFASSVPRLNDACTTPGSIDMAKVVLEHGRDERIGKMAADVIRDQEREIAEMQAWLAKRAPREPSP
jgi:hypothetical protein